MSTTPNAPTAGDALSAQLDKLLELAHREGVNRFPPKWADEKWYERTMSQTDEYRAAIAEFTAALLAARREVEAARDALGRIETLAHGEADSFGLSGNLHEIMTECRATIAHAGEKMTETTALEDRERELHACRSLREDAETVANFITGWWPGLEDGLSWPTDADHAERNPVFAAAERIRAALAATQEGK